MIDMIDITKRFGALVALDRVSVSIEGGKVHGVLGENGAGKSTIMNVLFGLLKADSGIVKVDGRDVRIESPRAARAAGIGMVHQHFKLVSSLSVVENLSVALGIGVGRAREDASRWMERLGWRVPLEERVENLAVGQQQRIEIIKALLGMDAGSTGRSRTLILDEPTAVLTPQEAAELFGALETLKAGGVAIVFISHKLAEVQRICDDVTILRRGKVVFGGKAQAFTAPEMAEQMVGAKVEMPRLVREPTGRLGKARPAPVLDVQALCAGRAKDVTLRVEAGEIVGVAGVDGNGQADLVQAIVGGRPIERGYLFLAGEEATRESIRWRTERLAYIAEDRQRQAVVLPLTVQENLLLKDYRRRPYSRRGWLRFGTWRAHAKDLVQRYDVRCGSLRDTVGRLSGGNQQKVVLARELYDASKQLVVAVNPTRGLDVGATAFVMRQLLEVRARGAGVLLVHSDLDELLAVADRVLVIFEGRVVESLWPRETKEGIGCMMMGVWSSAFWRDVTALTPSPPPADGTPNAGPPTAECPP